MALAHSDVPRKAESEAAYGQSLRLPRLAKVAKGVGELSNIGNGLRQEEHDGRSAEELTSTWWRDSPSL